MTLADYWFYPELETEKSINFICTFAGPLLQEVEFEDKKKHIEEIIVERSTLVENYLILSRTLYRRKRRW